MKNKLAGIILGSTIALTGCDKPNNENIVKESIEEVKKDSSEKTEEILKKVEKKYFNNFFQNYIDENGNKKISLNPYGIIFPIGVEEAKSQKNIEGDFSNYYLSGKTSDEYYSTLENFNIGEGEKRSRFTNKKYKSQIKSEIKINYGNAIGYSSQEYSNTSDKDLFKEEHIKQNNKITNLRGIDIKNDFLISIGEEFKIYGVENIKISGKIYPFSNNEIGDLYEIGLKYYTPKQGENEISVILNLIKMYDIGNDKLSNEDYKFLQKIIGTKRISYLDVNYDIIGNNKEISASYLNFLVILFYTICGFGTAKIFNRLTIKK